MTRVLAIFIVATAGFVAGAYYGQSDLEVKLESEQIQSLRDQSESLANENAQLKSQIGLIKKALQTNILTMAKIQQESNRSEATNGKLNSSNQEQSESSAQIRPQPASTTN